MNASPGARTSSTSALIVGSTALFTDMLVHGLAIPVLPRLPAVVESGPAATGILFSCYATAMVVSTIFAGRFVDRVGPKTPLLIGLVGLAAATLLFALGGPYWLLLVARLAQGVAGGMSWVAALSLIAATTPIQRRGQAMGIALSTITVGVLVGPPLAGLLVQQFGPTSPFLLASGVALLDGVLRLALVKGSPRVTDDVSGPMAVVRVRGALPVVALVVVGAAIFSGIEPIVPTHLAVDTLTIGLLFGLAALTAIIANPIAGALASRIPLKAVFASGIVVTVIAMLLVAAAGQLWQTALGMALLGIGAGLLLAPTATLIGDLGAQASPPTLGGAYALYNLAYAFGLAGSPIVTGICVQLFGFGSALTVMAAVIAVIGVVAVIGVRRIGPTRSV